MIWYETHNTDSLSYTTNGTDIGHNSDHPDPHQTYVDAKRYISHYYNEIDTQYTRESDQFAEDEVSLLEQSFQVRHFVYYIRYTLLRVPYIVLSCIYVNE